MIFQISIGIADIKHSTMENQISVPEKMVITSAAGWRIVLAQVALRRTKEGVNLPSLLLQKTVEMCTVDFDVLYTVARADLLYLVEEAVARETPSQPFHL
jgi:hypothetical protein